jgi:hypothetical protein
MKGDRDHDGVPNRADDHPNNNRASQHDNTIPCRYALVVLHPAPGGIMRGLMH